MNSQTERGGHSSKMESIEAVKKPDLEDMPHPAAIASFVNSLSSALPTRCFRFYFQMFDLLRSAPDVAEELRHSHPEIFSTTLRFMTTPRTRRELLALWDALILCHCPNDDTDLCHTSYGMPSSATETVDLFFSSLCGIVVAGLKGLDGRFAENIPNWATLDNLVRESRKSLKHTGRATWPSEHADIFFGKPAQVVGMLWRIFDTFPTTEQPLFLFYIIWKLSPATVFRVVASIEDGYWPKQLIGHANSVFDEGGWAESELHSHLLPQLLMEVALGFTQNLDLAFLLLWSNYNLDVVRFASRLLLSSAFKDRSDEQTAHLSQLGSLFWTIASAIPLSDGTLADFSDEERKALSPRIEAPHGSGPRSISGAGQWLDDIDANTARHGARINLMNAALSEACAAPECSQTTSTMNRRFQGCGKCCLARYCSKECQVAAWRHPVVPHKPVCRFLQELNAKLQVDWAKIRMPAQQDTLHKRSEYLSLQECKDLEIWLFKLKSCNILGSLRSIKKGMGAAQS
ncbi:hypothetical protein CYLTODRAFT_478917 [Cylindrobasidium torrendii FP15055 ss-10]|uniref:MYND-type domain-containing protein n=1 Tax=Cylindrobasidium torrendii FP15055 ss-10 TaxID=1314674 RepID=A0A0D7AU49_9AGAR|nr:hypothetical protein CYLTODRAFT_478917 [Cylindrobasidium torrendii FP15055 ss-10]